MDTLADFRLCGGPDSAGYVAHIRMEDGTELIGDMIYNQELRCWEYGVSPVDCRWPFATEHAADTATEARAGLVADFLSVWALWRAASSADREKAIRSWQAWQDSA